MELKIEVPDSIFETIKEWLSEHCDVNVTVDELKANPAVISFLVDDIPNMYNEMGSNGFENMDLAEELNY